MRFRIETNENIHEDASVLEARRILAEWLESEAENFCASELPTGKGVEVVVLRLENGLFQVTAINSTTTDWRVLCDPVASPGTVPTDEGEIPRRYFVDRDAVFEDASQLLENGLFRSNSDWSPSKELEGYCW